MEEVADAHVHLEGEDIIFTLYKRLDDISPLVGEVFQKLASVGGGAHSLELKVGSAFVSSPYEAGSKADSLIHSFEDELKEEISYEATLRAGKEVIELQGELVFRDVHYYVLMDEDKWQEWKKSHDVFNHQAIAGKPVIYYQMSDNTDSIDLDLITSDFREEEGYTSASYSIDGESVSHLNLSKGASTFIVTVKDNGSTNETEVIIKVGSVFIGRDTSKLYTIEDAVSIGQNQEVFVQYNTAFSSAKVARIVYGGTNHRIGSSTTVVLPYNGTLSSGISDNPGAKRTSGPLSPNNEYVRLTIPQDISVNLKGRFVVNAKRAAQGTKFQGHVTENYYSILHLEKDSFIEIEHRGELYALGFIEGEGFIEALNGATVYDGLFISSFRGGSASSKIEDKVFPFDQFTVAQIEVPLTIHLGSSYIAKALLYANEKYYSGDFPIVGRNGMIRIKNNGTVVKTFNTENGQNTFTIHGNGTIDNSSVKMGSLSASTKGRAIPFDGTWHFVISNGTSLTIGASVAFLPGSSFSIESNARVTVKSSNTFTIFKWAYKDDYNNYPNAGITDYYRHQVELEYSAESEAYVINEGTLIIEKGAGIAGKVEGVEPDIKEGALREYMFYRVEGSAKTALPVEYEVGYSQ